MTLDGTACARSFAGAESSPPSSFAARPLTLESPGTPDTLDTTDGSLPESHDYR